MALEVRDGAARPTLAEGIVEGKAEVKGELVIREGAADGGVVRETDKYGKMARGELGKKMRDGRIEGSESGILGGSENYRTRAGEGVWTRIGV